MNCYTLYQLKLTKQVLELEGNPNNLITVLTVVIVVIILYFRFKSITKNKVVKGKGLIMLFPLIIVLLLTPLVLQNAGHLNWLRLTMFVILGVLLSIMLLKFVRFELNQENNQIYMQRDKRTIFLLLSLIPLKLFLRQMFQHVPVQELNTYFYIMGMATISVWTVVTYANFLQLKRERDLNSNRVN